MALALIARFFSRPAATPIPETPTPTPSYLQIEQQAMAGMRGLAQELLQAANALDYAAEQLKFAGKGKPAGQVKKAASKARAATEGLV